MVTKRVLGAEDLYTLTIAINLASSLMHQRKYAEAEVMPALASLYGASPTEGSFLSNPTSSHQGFLGRHGCQAATAHHLAPHGMPLILRSYAAMSWD